MNNIFRRTEINEEARISIRFATLMIFLFRILNIAPRTRTECQSRLAGVVKVRAPRSLSLTIEVTVLIEGNRRTEGQVRRGEDIEDYVVKK